MAIKVLVTLLLSVSGDQKLASASPRSLQALQQEQRCKTVGGACSKEGALLREASQWASLGGSVNSGEDEELQEARRKRRSIR